VIYSMTNYALALSPLLLLLISYSTGLFYRSRGNEDVGVNRLTDGFQAGIVSAIVELSICEDGDVGQESQ
jgi:hypothetical protein